MMKLTDITLRGALELAGSVEEKAAARYEALAKKFAGDKPIADVFSQLAEDEAAHESHFRDLARKIPEQGAPQASEQALDLVRASAASKFFDPDALAQTDQIETPADALREALGFEKATLFFYQSLKDVLDDSEELNHLVEAEKGHISLLMRVLISDARFRGLDDTW
jgi:rubrerythrin